jgi:hypothetical protein
MNDNDASAADPLGQIADEFVEAFRRGKRPSVEEFARRYPQHADEIRDMLPALVLMEKAKSGDDTPGPRRQAAAPPLRQLGDYEILREVGRGGMGVVYEARQLSLGRHVAIKVLPPHALLDPRQLGRFQREARAAARLHHTNIVPVFGVGEQGGCHYYVMQFIQGLGLDLVLDELRRLRRPGRKQAPTHGETPGRPTDGPRGASAAEVARSLLSEEFRPPEEASPVTTAPREPAAPARIVTGSNDGTARVWDARTGTPLLDLKGHTNFVTSVSFSPDAARIVTGSGDGTAKVWDARTGTPLLDLKGHTNVVTSVSFSSDPRAPRRIVTGSHDGTAKVWDARTGTPLLDLN